MYQKKALRQNFANYLVDPVASLKNSKSIISKILTLDEFKTSKSILLYSPMKTEVEISPLFKYCRNKTVYLPSSKKLLITEITEETELSKNKFDFQEPTEPDSILPRTLDLAIIPGIAFSKKGVRLGHGIGWYDRLFQFVDTKVIIGICFGDQVIEKIPLERHDRKVNILITENSITRTSTYF